MRVSHPRFGARRQARVGSWWGKAWMRAVEESSYAEEDLRAGRALARSGEGGGLTVDSGAVVAAVAEGADSWTARVAVPVLDTPAAEAFVEVLAVESGRVAALLAGDLPHQLVEHAEEAGVELLPYGGELDATCSCDAWLQPCRHALAVAVQVGWLLDADTLVLLHLRGLDREQLLARAWSRQAPAEDGGWAEDEEDLEVGLDAAQRAARIIELLEDSDRDVDHLF